VHLEKRNEVPAKDVKYGDIDAMKRELFLRGVRASTSLQGPHIGASLCALHLACNIFPGCRDSRNVN
jgi:hypothetical protein